MLGEGGGDEKEEGLMEEEEEVGIEVLNFDNYNEVSVNVALS